MKGIDILIDAIDLLHRRNLRVTVTLVGGSPDENRLRAQVDRQSLSDAVRFAPVTSAPGLCAWQDCGHPVTCRIIALRGCLNLPQPASHSSPPGWAAFLKSMVRSATT